MEVSSRYRMKKLFPLIEAWSLPWEEGTSGAACSLKGKEKTGFITRALSGAGGVGKGGRAL